MQNELIFWRKAIQICQMLCKNQELYRSMRDRINDRENRNPAMLWRAWNEKPLASTITTTGSLNSIAAVTVCCKHDCVQSSSAHSECTDELKDPDHVQMLWGWLVVMNPHITCQHWQTAKGLADRCPRDAIRWLPNQVSGRLSCNHDHMETGVPCSSMPVRWKQRHEVRAWWPAR
jgi:hypothetical protein